MNSTFRRVAAAFALLSLVSVLAAAPANAATPTGVGTSGGNVTVASLDYGAIIKAALVGENNSDTIDPVNGTPTATETLAPLDVTSGTINALNLSVPHQQTTSTGAAQELTTSAFDLATLGAPGVTGTVNPATLKSLVDTTGAQSTLTSTLADLDLAGLLNVDSASVNLGGVAGPTGATANRSATADAITVLDFQALLNLLGIDVTHLTLDAIIGLLDDLDEVGVVESITHLVGTDSAADLAAKIDELTGDIETTENNLIGVQTIAGTCTGAEPILVTLGITCGQVGTTITTLTHTLSGLINDLTALVQTMINVLAGTPLLAVDGVTAGATAIAKDTEANSSAVVVGAINHIRVGGLDFGGVDANATLTQITDLAKNITDTLNTVLSDNIDLDLANLLSVKLLERTTNVSTVGDYVTAVAGITALAVTVTPPDICATLNNLVLFKHLVLPTDVDVAFPDSPVRSALQQLGSFLPPCIPLDKVSADALQPQVAAGFPALTGPITLKAASVNSVAEFKTVAAPTTTTTPVEPALPRTGMNATLLLVVGGLMAAAALGVRRVVAPARARSKTDE